MSAREETRLGEISEELTKVQGDIKRHRRSMAKLDDEMTTQALWED